MKSQSTCRSSQKEKLRNEAAALPGLRAELEALKERHFQALELMGERDGEIRGYQERGIEMHLGKKSS